MSDARADIEIKAAPAVVYHLISDVPRLPRWAAETTACRWLDGADGPATGARFRGTNRNGLISWTTTCRVLEAEPGESFSWRVTFLGAPIAEWRYDIEPTAEGCRVTESMTDLRGVFFRQVIGPFTTGLRRSRAEHNRRNIERTLEGLKAYAESA